MTLAQEIDSKPGYSLYSKCRGLALSVIKECRALSHERVAWPMTDQLVRSSTSIGANIVEARAASSRRDFKRYFEIALKSANETKYWLGLLLDSGLAKDSIKMNKLIEETEIIADKLGCAVVKLKDAA